MTMKTILALIALLLAVPCSAQTFGLGDDPVEASAVSGETFGLSCPAEPVSIPVPPKAEPPKATPKPRSTTPYVSPLGFHRHQFPDGTVFEHSDINHGDAAAHTGLSRPWPKYFGRQAPNVPAPSGSVCPPGGT